MKITSFLLILLLSLWGCTPTQPSGGPLKVVTTTGMIHDAVVNIAQDKLEAEALMGPGVDPHLYKATQGDLTKLNQADIVFYNGLLLEGKMGEILQKLGRTKPVFAVAEAVPTSQLQSSQQYENAYDPHVWFDVSRWQLVVQEISKRLQEQDSANASFYQDNTTRYLQALDSLHTYARNQIQSIPEEGRILVTAHDAFGYFGDAYGIRVEGLQGISTVSDFGLRDIAQLIDLIIANKVKAIFIETSVSDKAIRAVVNGCREKGHEVRVGGSLYSDAMGQPGTFEGTYVGMVTTNVNTITNALK